MKPQEALSLVTQVCVIYRGTLQEHQSLQQALEVLKTAITPATPVVKDAKK